MKLHIHILIHTLFAFSVALGEPLYAPCLQPVTRETEGEPGDSVHISPDIHEITPSRTYLIEEITVSVMRQGIQASHAPSAISLMSGEELLHAPTQGLGGLLDRFPGVFSRNYGSMHSVGTLSIRGMYSEHTLVLVDGQRFNSLQNSQTDFGIFPLSVVDHVEVARGGYSSFYGPDAIGGVVNVVTRSPLASFQGKAQSSFGSSGFFSQDMYVGGSSSTTGWWGSIRREIGRGDFEFGFDDGKSITRFRRQGSDFRVVQVGGGISQSLPYDFHSRLFFSHVSADRGTPGPMTHPLEGGSARLSDENTRAQFSIDWSGVPVKFMLNGFFQQADQSYVDRRLVTVTSFRSSKYLNRVVSLSPEFRFSSDQMSVAGGVEYSDGTIESNVVRQARRVQRSMFVSGHYAVKLPFAIPHEVLFFPSARYDTFSDVGGDAGARLGVNVGIFRAPDIRIRSSYGSSYRPPSFNELYWIAGGNPALRPEYSASFDAGATGSFHWLGIITGEVNYFSIATRDRILWSPGAGGIWSPRNIDRVTSEGLEFEATWVSQDRTFGLTGGLTLNDVRKRNREYDGDPTTDRMIVYVPGQTMNVSGWVRIGPATLNLQHSRVSFRYTNATNDRFLPGYSVTSAALTTKWNIDPLRLTLKLESSNIFDTNYQILPLFPMPLREYRITFGVEL